MPWFDFKWFYWYFFFEAKRVLPWMAPHIWAFFLLFWVYKEEPQIEFYCGLNSSYNTFIDLMKHRAPWESCACYFQSFKLTSGFNKNDHEKKKSMNTKVILWRKNWCQSVNYIIYVSLILLRIFRILQIVEIAIKISFLKQLLLRSSKS